MSHFEPPRRAVHVRTRRWTGGPGFDRAARLALQYLMPWALLLLGLFCIFQFERMRNEERVPVEAFPQYGDYMARTARLVPGVY
jgi:protein-S-isoprenylcysteine O-methyltransferase Ste14